MANMLFQHTYEWVVDKSPHTGQPKTATSRIVKAGDMLLGTGYAVMRNGRALYEVGQRFAAMPARGVRGIRKVAEIEIAAIARYDVRTITPEQVAAEGFANRYQFLETWCGIHDKEAGERLTSYFAVGVRDAAVAPNSGAVEFWRTEWLKTLQSRPAERYTAWYLTFRVTAVYVDAIATARQLLAAKAAA